jgi:DNA invertase Pin-like site-specific DNA recombinase
MTPRNHKTQVKPVTILEAYQSGQYATQIAAERGLPVGKVKAFLKVKCGQLRRYRQSDRPVNPELIRAIVELLEGGLSLTQTAKRLPVGRTKAARLYKEAKSTTEGSVTCS